MVNGISSLTVWQEVALLIRLRWRIQRNQLRQKNAKLELVGLIVTGLFFFFFVGVIAFAFYEGAATMTRDNRMSWLALLGFGLGTTAQETPSQCSTTVKGCPPPPPSRSRPPTRRPVR